MQTVDEQTKPLFIEVFVDFIFRNPSPIIPVCFLKFNDRNTSSVERGKIVSSHSYVIFESDIFFLSNRLISNCMDDWRSTNMMASPFLSKRFKQVCSRGIKILAKEDRSCWKFPFLSMLVFKDQVYFISCCIMKRVRISDIRVCKRPVLRSKSIC